MEIKKRFFHMRQNLKGFRARWGKKIYNKFYKNMKKSKKPVKK